MIAKRKFDGKEIEVKVGEALAGVAFEYVQIEWLDIIEPDFVEWFTTAVMTRLSP